MKNIKYYAAMFGMATFMLTGCGIDGISAHPETEIVTEVEDTNSVELEDLVNEIKTNVEENIMLDDLTVTEVEISDVNNYNIIVDEKVDEKLTVIEIGDIIISLNENSNYNFNFDYRNNVLSIEENGSFVCSIDDYANLELLFSKGDINSLKLKNIGLNSRKDVIDFSRFDLASIKQISFEDCSPDFDYDIFANQKYTHINFKGDNLFSIKSIVTNGSDENTIIDLFTYENTGVDFIQWLVDNNIVMGEFSGSFIMDVNSLSKMYSLLGNLNANSVSLSEYDLPLSNSTYTSNVDLQMNLNDRIKSVNIMNFPNINLGNISINSNRKDVHLWLSGINLTEETNLAICDTLSLSMYGVSCCNINVLNALSNIKYLSYDGNDGLKFSTTRETFDEVMSELKENQVREYIKK